MPYNRKQSEGGKPWANGRRDVFTETIRYPEPAPVASTEPEKKGLLGVLKEKLMPTNVTKRVRILRGAASARWSVEPGQCLDLPLDVCESLVASGSARWARPDEPQTFATTYDPQ